MKPSHENNIFFSNEYQIPFENVSFLLVSAYLCVNNTPQGTLDVHMKGGNILILNAEEARGFLDGWVEYHALRAA